MGLGLLAQAAPVTQEKAQQEVSKFLLSKQKTSSNIVLASKAYKKTKAATTAAYYVFNIGNKQGWVIVSGDDRTNPILGYSDEGYFDEARIPANMKAWLDEYALQITQLDEVDPSMLKSVLAAPKAENVVDTRNSIAPMLTTKWDQATPYWNECPQFMNGETEEEGYELAYTGCVATSMSQLMKYYNYPEQTTQVIPSYTFTYSDGNYNYATVQMEELPITTFDWAHMKDTYTGAEDEIYTSAVAHLMYYVGCAIKSQYGTSSTGAYTDDIPGGFELFGYGSKLAYRNDYTQDVWDEMVYQELAAGRPMIYNGTAGSGGGHSFVCDGYEYGNYFHINWGWGGLGNGYFQLAVMNPYASGIGGSSSAEGYNMKQNIVYNVIPGGANPSGGGDEEAPVLTCTAVSGPSAWDRDGLSYPFKIYKSKIVKVSYSDHANSGKKFKTALALYDPNTDSFTICENSEGNGYFTVTTSALGETRQFGSGIQSNASNVIKFGAGLTGTYHLVGAYQLEGTSEWKLMKESDRHYLEVVMTNYSATGSAHPVINLQTTNWEFTGGEKVGVKEQVNVTVKNNSVDRFFGDLYLDFGGQQIDEYSQYTTVVTGEVMPGEESVITFNVTPTSSGTKSVKLMRLDSYGDLITIGTGSVTIAQSSEAQELNLSVVIQAENATTQPSASNIFGEIYDSHARFSATITNHSNGDYSKYVLAPLFIIKKNEDGTVAGGSMVTYKQSALSLAAGESKTLYFDFDNLAYGSTYAMNIYARNYVPDNEEGTHVENIVQPGQSVYYDILPGVITWTANGERTGYQPIEGFQIANNVAAVSLEGLTLINVVPNSNPNTLYFIDEGATAPASLNGCNIVAGPTASSIALTDGYPYFTPQSFTAQNISYTRIFDKARQDGVAENWSTIVLPFTPTACSASSNDMWIERFAQEEDGVAVFSEVENIEANVPYIIAINKAANLINTPITWSAANVLLKAEPIAYTSGKTYLMAGTFIEQSIENIYNVDAAGAIAKWGNSTIAPFRAYFKELVALENHNDILLPGEAQQGGIPGDVDGDGNVTSADVTALYDWILNGDDSNLVNGDQDGDGNITSSDVTFVYNILLGI
ncbi:MAG: C10 family peptidase [Muribaculaceae bacterium]|nr:C10 family peptidase [Muribaculaceae bacterium]